MSAKMCNFTSRAVTRPRQSIVIRCVSQTVEKRCNFTLRSAFNHATPREGLLVRQNVQLYLACSRSTTPIHCNFRCVTSNGRKKMQLYLAFLRSTTPIRGKGCSCPPKWCYFTYVRAFDHANPWEGVARHVTKCHFTTRSRARPHQSMVRVAFPTEASEQRYSRI